MVIVLNPSRSATASAASTMDSRSRRTCGRSPSACVAPLHGAAMMTTRHVVVNSVDNIGAAARVRCHVDPARHRRARRPGQLAGPAAQPLGLPARPRARADGPHRAQPDAARASAGRPPRPRRRARRRAERGGRAGRLVRRRTARAAGRRDPGRALSQRPPAVAAAPADERVEVARGDRRRHPRRPRGARSRGARRRRAARARGHELGGRDRPPPARHAGRHAVRRDLRQRRRRRARLRADLPLAAAHDARPADRRARRTWPACPTRARTAAPSTTARS